MKTQTQKENPFEVQDTILETLRLSKVNGFPFFAYTGIKDFVVMGNETEAEVMFKNIPKNPKKISKIIIAYDFGADLYKVYSYKNVKGIDLPENSYVGVFFDQLADLIVREMGVY